MAWPRELARRTACATTVHNLARTLVARGFLCRLSTPCGTPWARGGELLPRTERGAFAAIRRHRPPSRTLVT